VAIACSSCGGSESPFTSDEVADTFARHGIPLSEHVAGRGSDPLLSIFEPSRTPDGCEEALRVNVFSASAEVDAVVTRAGLKPGESRYALTAEDGKRVVGLVRRNVLVALSEFDCYAEDRVRKALDAIGD
jgi:hypothetical protein